MATSSHGICPNDRDAYPGTKTSARSSTLNKDCFTYYNAIH